jgi:hypothetical protein
VKTGDHDLGARIQYAEAIVLIDELIACGGVPADLVHDVRAAAARHDFEALDGLLDRIEARLNVEADVMAGVFAETAERPRGQT